MDIKLLIEVLFVVLLFIIFVLRAVYFCFVIKGDPIEAIRPKIPFIIKSLKKANSNNILKNVS